jgi:general secretion pathway protein N
MLLRPALILAVVVFLVTLLMRLPAGVLLPLLPADVSCTAPAGTVWSGSCGELRVGAVTVAGLSWVLHPAALLRLHLAADLSSQDPSARGHAQVELAHNGDVAITALLADVAMPSGSGLVPAGTSGSLQLVIDSARIQGAHLVAVQGKIELQQIHIENPPADLGGFELQFGPPDESATMRAQLRDLNGPLSVVGRLQLSPTGSYELEGSVAPRASASADLTQALQLLGPPDAQGRRAFSLAGSL